MDMKVVVTRPDSYRESRVDLVIDGKVHNLCITDYDSHGWSGLFIPETVGEGLSEALGIPLEYSDAKS